MALKNLTNDEMRIATLLAAVDYRPQMAGDAHLALALSEFEAMAPLFDDVQRRTANPAAAALIIDAARIDAEHDRLLRGTFALLEALETLAGDDGAPYAVARERLFPGGLSMAQRSYAEEAGEAQRAFRRLDDTDVALLRDTPLRGGRTAFDLVEAWVRAGAALEDVEKRRLQLEEPEAVGVVRSIDLRNRWIRAVRALETVVEIRGGGPHPVLEAIRRYEEKADRRAQSGGAVVVEPVAPTP
jgi:hypothetical protein